MTELLITIYLLATANGLAIDRQPPIPYTSADQCERARETVLRQAQAGVQVTAICVPRGERQPSGANP